MQETQWYIALGEKEIGPFTVAQLSAFARQGKLKAESQLRAEGATERVYAGSVEAIFKPGPPATPPPLPGQTASSPPPKRPAPPPAQARPPKKPAASGADGGYDFSGSSVSRCKLLETCEPA